MSPRTLWVFAVLLGALCGSSAGLLLRLVETADGWQILFYRSVSFSLTVLMFMIATNRRQIIGRFLKIGFWGMVAAVCLGMAFIAFIFSLLLTTVANAVFILSASPFIAALMARVLLNEAVSRRAWLCMTAALLGVAVMLADGAASGTLAGSAVALIAAFGYAAGLVAYRAGRGIDMMPATCLAGVLSALVCVPLVTTFQISQTDLTIAILLGVVQIGVQYILKTLAARHIVASEIALLSLLEVVAAPIWVWIAFGEVPALLTLAGGVVVLAAIIYQSTDRSKEIA